MSDRITTKFEWSGSFISLMWRINDGDLGVKSFVGNYHKNDFLPMIFPKPTFTIGGRQDIQTTILFREIQFSSCSGVTQIIQLEKPQYFTSGATPQLLKIGSRRFGHVQHQAILKSQHRREIEAFRFKNVQIATGFEFGEGNFFFKFLIIKIYKLSVEN
jgi:hypothetical protein